MMAGNKILVKFSNLIYDFELKYLEIYITRSKTLYWFPKTFYLWTGWWWYNLYIYNFNKNGKNCGWKYIWCAKSEVIFSTLNVYYMKLRGSGQIFFIDFLKWFLYITFICFSFEIQKGLLPSKCVLFVYVFRI